MGARIPVFYVEMDGTGIPVVRKEVQTVSANRTPNRPTRARPN